MMKQIPLFALDVGTRKVIGLLVVYTPKGFKINNVVMEEHQSRSMIDGQIQDIPQVAEVVERVKTTLEKRSGLKLTSAAVAAAGRALVTERQKVEQEMDSTRKIQEEDILALEFSAVQTINAFLNTKNREHSKRFIDQYHCVGYSVIRYLLDGVNISSLVGQRGYKAGVEIIATFLPRIIVDSLLAVLERSQLEMLSLTLEPIAALNLVVPKDMRGLNLALVDIGAGTSDIALTSGGSVHAYAMVPLAGDEVTEVVCDHFLLDFMEGERVKRRLTQDDKITTVNILEQKTVIQSQDILDIIKPVVEHIAEKIGQEIVSLNGKSPQAVFCVGGGSLTPGITQLIAEKLDIPSQNVTVKGYELTKIIPRRKVKFFGPELVTPIGIAASAKAKEAIKFIKVKFNDRWLQVMDLKKGVVLDALLSAGIRPQDIYAKPGFGITVELNGTVKPIKGKWGTMAEILVNSQEAGLDTPVKNDDEITFIPGGKGKDAVSVVGDLVEPLPPKRIFFQEEETVIPPLLIINGQPASLDDPVRDRAKIIYRERKSLGEVMEYLGISKKVKKEVLTFTLNGQLKNLEVSPFHLLVNERQGHPEDIVREGDTLQMIKNMDSIKIEDILDLKEQKSKISFNFREVEIPLSTVSIFVNGEPVAQNYRIQEEDQITTVLKDREMYLANVLSFVNFAITPPQGKRKLIMKVNGVEASFTTSVQEGDSVQVEWF